MQLAAFSSVLLEWHRLVGRARPADFHARALALLEPHLPFNMAWWGLALAQDGLPRVLQGHLHRLPPAFTDDWLAIADQDEVASEMGEQPGATVRYSRIFDGEPDDFDRRYGILHALSTAIAIDDTGLFQFLSIYRDESLPPFTEDERAQLELLVPHLFLAEEQQTRAAWQQSLASQSEMSARINERAWLEQASPAFCQLLMAEFPRWSGGQLPAELRRLLQFGAGQWQGRTLDATVSSVEGVHQLALKLRASLGLTPREEVVARAYAGGQSYKEIARDLRLAPGTVRGYLQQCYLKLGVSNKVSLGGSLRAGRGPAAAMGWTSGSARRG